MADVQILLGFIESADWTNPAAILDRAQYEDEDAVYEPENLNWLHGRNIPLAALMCAWRSTLLGHGGLFGEPVYRRAVLRYLTETGDGHGEEFSRIYTDAHTLCVLGAKRISQWHGTAAEVVAACDDWLLSRAGFLGLALSRRRAGSMREADRPNFELRSIVCDQPPVFDLGLSGCVQFGKRSWNHGDGRWLHLDNGGLFDNLRLVLDAVPEEVRATMLAAGSGDKSAIAECAAWAAKRAPQTGERYHFYRWTGGVAFWLDGSSAGQSTASGELCVIRYRDDLPWDVLEFHCARRGWRNTQESCRCEFDGSGWTLTASGMDGAIRVSRPAGELVSRHETHGGRMVVAEIVGVSAPPPLVPSPPPVVPAERPKKLSVWEKLLRWLRGVFS